MTKPVIPIFDRSLCRQRRDHSASQWPHYAFLQREAAKRLAERLDILKMPFRRVLDFGCRQGEMARYILKIPGIEEIIMSDFAPNFARMARRDIASISGGSHSPHCLTVVADEENLPFGTPSFDLVTSCLGLHMVNDLPGALRQIQRALKPGGLLLASLFGSGTLGALRAALIEAESEIYGGAGARIAPFTDIRSAGSLLQRAGFTEPVVDDDTITVTYDTLTDLMYDLRGMGETNTLIGRRKHADHRALFTRAHSLYGDRHQDGRLIAHFHILTLTAWKPEA